VSEAISVYRSGEILSRRIFEYLLLATPQEVFDYLRQSFQANKGKGEYMLVINGSFGGPQGGQWWIDVKDGKYKMGKGKIFDPNVTFVATDKDWVAVSKGQLGGT
jgi:hypothetical protein